MLRHTLAEPKKSSGTKKATTGLRHRVGQLPAAHLLVGKKKINKSVSTHIETFNPHNNFTKSCRSIRDNRDMSLVQFLLKTGFTGLVKGVPPIKGVPRIAGSRPISSSSEMERSGDQRERYVNPFSKYSTQLIHKDTETSLRLMAKSPPFYAILAVQGRPYYVQEGDIIVLPKLHGVELGQVLNLHQAYELGTRDHILRGKSFVDPRFFTCKGTVLEHTRSQPHAHRPWRRKGHRKLRIHFVENTLIRVSVIRVNSNV